MSTRESNERIDELLDGLTQSASPPVVERVEELLHCLMELYGEGLAHVMKLADDETRRALADDEVVGHLLVLHDLHPDDVITRVQAALDRVRPYLGSHAGGVSLTGVDDQGVAHVQLEGSCDGCPSSAVTLSNAIEGAILSSCPDVVAIEAEESSDPPLLQIQPFDSCPVPESVPR